MCCETATVFPFSTPLAAARSASLRVTVLLATPGSPLAPLRLSLRPVPVGNTGAQAPDAGAFALGLEATAVVAAAVAAAGELVGPPPPELACGAVVHPTAITSVTTATPRRPSGWPIHRLDWSMLFLRSACDVWPSIPSPALTARFHNRLW